MNRSSRRRPSNLIAVLTRNAERGATMVEYAIIASLIAAVGAASVKLLGIAVSGLFNTLPGKF